MAVVGTSGATAKDVCIAAGSDSLPCWCDRGEWRVTFRTHQFGLVRCTACGCYRIDPPPISMDEESAAFYTDYYLRPESSGFQAVVSAQPAGLQSRFWQVAEKVPEVAHPAGVVLDIGCGEGHLCAELREAGWQRVTGIDISNTRVARAREMYPDIDFYDRPIQQTGIEPGSFDLIVMDNVIEHLPDPKGMVSGLRTYLAPGGRLVVITPNMESGHFRLLGRRWTPELAPHTHIFLFTPASLSQLFTESGFEVEAVGHFHIPLYQWRILIKRLVAGDAKGSIWTMIQEAGGIYGRIIRAGSMTYVVGRPADFGKSVA